MTIKKELGRVQPGFCRRALPYAAAVFIATMLCLTINFRAFTELGREAEQFEKLSAQVESATSENLALQEEIHYLKNDINTIGREARKYGLEFPGEKDPTPVK